MPPKNSLSKPSARATLSPVRQARQLSIPAEHFPTLIASADDSARFAYEEFLFGQLRNEYTRVAYQRAIRRFLAWCADRKLALNQIAPKDVGQYLDQHQGSTATKKQHLAAIRHLFDVMVTRHAVVLNPAASVRGDRYVVIEGKTPEISIEHARRLLRSINTGNIIGLRDRAAIATLIYTAARVGAVAKLKRGNFRNAGDQWTMRFSEKGGKSREIPVRHDLQLFFHEYITAAGLWDAPKHSPLFRATIRREKRLTDNGLSLHAMCRIVKRRMKDAGLSDDLSAHSFRVTTITDLLEQGVPLEDVQYLAGHADPRTTRLYDRRRHKVTRNIAERISI